MKVLLNVEKTWSRCIYHTIYIMLYIMLMLIALQDIVPMEQVSSMVSNGGGSVTMQRDDEYRNRIMKSKCVSASMYVSLYVCVHVCTSSICVYVRVCTTPSNYTPPPPL